MNQESGSTPPEDAPSVIERIGEITGSKPRVLLRDERTEGSPMQGPFDPGERVEAGKYVVQGELGRGGVGTVHKGHDKDLGRDVAMKFLHEKFRDEPAVLHRFVEEAQIGGQLQHPGIVPVYDLGMVDGKPFFAMKLVRGQTLAKKLADRESPASDRRTFLAIFEGVCQTLAYAHARGVVHRDLKPANIMVGSFGEVQVVDWGMGKVMASGGDTAENVAAERPAEPSVIKTVRSEGQGTQSLMGSVMGTPAYMPPEQARGDVEAMDERSDVFALGAILCEILTGEPPYVGEPDELIGMAAMAELDGAHARLDACGGEPAMVELASRCLTPDPKGRPKSAEVVANSVHDHLAAVESRVHEARVEAAEAKVRAAALKRTQTLGISLTAVIAAGLVVSLWFWRAANEAAANETVAKQAAEASAKRAEENEQRAIAQTRVAERELARAVEIKRLITEMLQSVTPEQAAGADITLLKGILDTASKRLTEDAIDDDLVAAELHALTGSVYRSIGLYPKAELHLPVALDIRRRVLGTDHPATLLSMGNLAIFYRDQGRYAEAETIQLETLESRKRVLGEEHPDTLASMGHVAVVYRDQGRYAEAETLGLRALEIKKRVLGEEHPQTLESMANLVIAYSERGRYDEAESLALETLEIQKRVLGDENPSTLNSMANLAVIHRLRGDHAKSEPLELETLEIRKRVLGDEHPSTLASMGNLANCYIAQGRHNEAEPLFSKMLEICRRVLGDEHADTLASMISLGNLYTDQRRFAEAEPLISQALETQSLVLGDEHPDRLKNIANLARFYLVQGRYPDAEQLILRTLDAQKRVLGVEHASTLSCMGNLALAYNGQGRYAEAVQLLLEILEIRERVLSEGHETTLQTMRRLAAIYSQQGRLDEAEPFLLRTLEICERVHGEDHPDTVTSLGHLANHYFRQNRYAEVEPYNLQTLEIQTRVLGAEHPNTLGTMTNLGVLYNSLGRFEDAIAMLETSLGHKRRVLGMQHPWTGIAMDGLVTAYLKSGRTDDALPLQRELLDKKLAEAYRADANAVSLNRAAWTLLTHEVAGLRDPQRALELAERARTLAERAGSDLLAAVLDTLALAQHQTGDTAAAIETLRRALALIPAGSEPNMAQRLAEYEAALKR